MSYLLDLVRRHHAGESVGICSVCSAHPLVIESALRQAAANDSPALIEATSNQVNQDGGYTGMKPADFRNLVQSIAKSINFPAERVLLGGDHLGPNCWQHLPTDVAMDKAQVLVEQYVAAGFHKIHLDCSMPCAGDTLPLSDAVIAARAARLCLAIERVWKRLGGEAPVYIVGSEVPTPGGAHEALDGIQVTTPQAALDTVNAHRAAFDSVGIADAWARVIGLVVQPGVEFDHDKVVDYQPQKAGELTAFIASQPGLVYEAHSTDYQSQSSLTALVRDHFAILKVGPGVTFALREAIWALDTIERESLGESRSSRVKEIILNAMQTDPTHWEKYYHSTADDLHRQLQYSLSDRIRYYWPVKPVAAAVDRLFNNLDAHPPSLSLLSQYLPGEFQSIREGKLPIRAKDLVVHHIGAVMNQYAAACGYREVAP
jgi:D-tagatose-1,6-bisphosphate aldolase subunit GatZ/KbaZ